VVSQGRATEIGDTHAGTRCVPQDVCWFWGVTFHIKRAKFPRLQASLGEGVALGTWHTVEHNTLTAKAATLAEEFQRSRAHGSYRAASMFFEC